MGVGDANLAARIGFVLGWTSCEVLLTGTVTGLALAAIYRGALMATHPGTPHQPYAARAVHPGGRALGHRALKRSRRVLGASAWGFPLSLIVRPSACCGGRAAAEYVYASCPVAA